MSFARRISICVPIFVLLSFTITAQRLGDATIEEARALYDQDPTAWNYLEYAYLHWFTDKDTAIIFMREAVDLSKRVDDERVEMRAYFNLGRFFAEQVLFDSSEVYFDRAIALAYDLNLLEDVGYGHNTRAYFRFNNSNDIQGAIDDVNKALAAFRAINEKLGASFCYQNLGDFYTAFNQYPKAVEMYSKVFEVREGMDSVTIYNQIEAHWNYASALLSSDREDEAIATLNKGIDIAQEPSEIYNGFLWVRLHLIRAQAWIEKGNLVRAQQDVTEASKYIDGTTFLFIRPLYDYTNGLLAFHQKNFAKAEEELSKVIVKNFNELGVPTMKLEAIKMMEEIMMEKGDLTQAYRFSKMESEVIDTLFDPRQLGFLLTDIRDSDDQIVDQANTIASNETLMGQLDAINTRNKVIIIILLLLFICLIYGYINYRHREALRREQQRMNISRDLHDQVGGLLTGIAMQSDMAQMAVEQKGVIPDLSSISNMSRQAMDEMSDVLWAIDARSDHAVDLLRRIKEYAHEIFDPLGISVEITERNIPENKIIDARKRQNIYLIFKEAITNIVKHAAASQVEITLSNKQKFILSIKDNGRGRMASGEKRTGQGLRNFQARAEELGGTLEIIDGEGTEVKLICPSL